MNESIRDYLKRRVRWTMGVGFLGWLLVLSPGMTKGRTPPIAIGTAALGMLLFLASLGSMLFVRCPRCRGRIGQSIAWQVAFYWIGRRVNYCPYCGVHLDEPLQPAGSPITPR